MLSSESTGDQPTAPEFTVAMLAGGAGQRLGGRDKSRIVVDGDEIGSRTVVTALLAGANEVLAIGGDPESLGSQGWRVIPDLFPGEGPLGGLITALKAARNDWVVVVGCDQPDLTPGGLVDLVQRALETSKERHVDVAITYLDGFALVTHSAWNIASITVLEKQFNAGERSIQRVLALFSSLAVEPLDDKSLMDIDTPADLASALSRPE